MAYDPLSSPTPKKSGGPAPSVPAPKSAAAFDPLTGSIVPTAKKQGATSKKSKKGFLGFDLPDLPGRLPNLPAIGITTDKKNPLTQVSNLVTDMGPGLVKFGGGLLKELAPENPLKYLKPGQQSKVAGWSGVEKKMPLTGSILESAARTGRQIPDTAVAIRPGGPGFGQSNLGHQIRDEGYLSTGLAKLGDLSLLAGGAGLAVKGVTGGGKAAQAGRLERLAGATSEAAKLGKVKPANAAAQESKLAKAAFEAEVAGDVAKALDLARAADQLSKAQRLRGVVAQSGKGTRAAEKFVEGALKVARGGDRASALPFVPTQKALALAGKGLGAAAKSAKLAPVAERAAAAVDRLRQRGEVGDLYHETVRAPFEGEMHNVFERHGIESVARDLSREEQAAIYLTKSQEALDPAIRDLVDAVDEMDPDVRPDILREILPDVSPEVFELARAFADGTLPEAQMAKMQAAADALSAVQTGRESRYVTGRGTSRQLSDAALEARRQRAAGESADMDVQSAVERRTERTRGRLAAIRSEMDDLNTAPDPDPVPMSRAQERQLTRDNERVRRQRARIKGEVSRGERLMASAARQVEAAQTRAANRTGQVIGRARDRLERADQLETGLAARQRQAELKARRLAKAANKADESAAEMPDPKPAKPKAEAKPAPKAETPAAKSSGDPYIDKLLEADTAWQTRMDDEPMRALGFESEEALAAAIKEAQGGPAKGAGTLAKAPKAADAPAPKLSGKARAEQNAAAKAAADEARAEANKLKGIKPAPSRSKVLSDVNLDAQRAHTANKVETETVAKMAGREVERQRAAVEQAQTKLTKLQSDEAARRDRFERENQVRADRAQQKRFETLQKREADALTKLAEETEAAINSVEAAPPQDRPALIVAKRAKEFALSLAEAWPDRASEFLAMADDIADTKAKLDAKGVKTEYFFGGPELGKPANVPPTAKLRNAKTLQNERNRKSGVLARNIKAQVEKYAKETLDMLHNEFRGHVRDTFGSTVKDELSPDRFATSDELARGLDERGLVAWDPETGKLLDVADIDANSAVLDKNLYETLKKYSAGKDPNLALKVYDKLTGGWKHSVLALSPRWHIGNIVGNGALATLGAGLTPAQIAKNLGEARRLVKAFEEGGDVPAEHLASMERLIAAGFNNPDLAKVENARALGRAINKSYHFNGYVDSVNRTMIYLAKHKSGVSAEAAVSMALKAAGDFSKMTPFERNVVRRIIPFYAWQRHITRLAFSLPIEHPSRVAWTMHLADLESRLNPDPGADNEFNEGTVPFGDKRLNVRQFFPFSSSFFTDPTYRGAGYQVNPILKTGVAAATGFNLGKMKPVSGKEFDPKNPSRFGAPMEPLAVKKPAGFASFIGQQFPQVTTARDLVSGEVPVRYDTGEPRKVGKGASKKNAKPTLTGRGRKETIARFLGVPIPEKETKPISKK